MPVITITSDWNQNDHYLASVKGKILSQNPDCRIVDINNQLTPFNGIQAAFVIRNSYPHFPKKSVHINFVNAEANQDSPYVAFAFEDHFFVGTDNGTQGLLIPKMADNVVRLKSLETEGSLSFPGLNTFSQAACYLLKNQSIRGLGEAMEGLKETIPLRPQFDTNQVTGTVIYTDSYGNVITNISKEAFEEATKGKSFKIYVQSKHYMISRINKTYGEVDPGELIALFNSSGLLEIAIRNGNAKKLLNLHHNSGIKIAFDNP